MRFWANLIGYQLVWFCTVTAAARGLAWPGPLAFALFAAWQLSISRHWAADVKLIAMGWVLGMVVDGSLSLAGWISYAAPLPALPRGGAPVWIVTLWASFALTINETFAYLKNRLWLAALVGSLGGPAAYAGAWHGWHAVILILPSWRALAALAVGWGAAMPLLVGLAGRATKASGSAA